MANRKRWVLSIALLLLLLVVFLAGWFVMANRENRAKVPGADSEITLTVTSSSFTDGGTIPARFTCDGENVSPQLSISAPPATTKSLIVTMDDPDASFGSFVHWVVFNAPPGLRALPIGASMKRDQMQGALEGENSFGNPGYGGPCPPAGAPHHYVFRVYALDKLLPLAQGASSKAVTAAAEGHVVAEGRIVGLYGRGK